MSMITPIVNEISAFDAREEHIFAFSVSGGDQVAKNEIKIINSITGETVYNNTINSFRFTQTVPSNTLENGIYYSVSFRTFDMYNNASNWSNYQPFYCYTTPLLALNLEQGQLIISSSVNVELTYDQVEDELMNYAVIKLYSDNDILLQTSEDLYNSSEPPFTLAHTFEGLDNNTYYKISATVVTVNGTVVDSEKVRIQISYTVPELSTAISVEPNNCEGYVTIKTDFRGIEGTSNPQEAVFIDDEMVDCVSCDPHIFHTNTSRWVKWEEEFTVPKNFILRTWFYPSTINETIIYLSSNVNENFYCKINLRRGELYDYVELETENGTKISSNGISHINGNSFCFLWVKIVNDNYEVIFKDLTTQDTNFEWNVPSNMNYNMTTDLTYIDEDYETYSESSITYPLTNEIDYILIGNGIYDQFDITKNIDLTYSEERPIFDYFTVLDCNFKGNLNGGNTDIIASQITAIEVKRKDANSVNWISLFKKEINRGEDTNITFIDRLSPNTEQTYAIVPTILGVEGDYLTKTIKPNWTNTFITDGIKTFKLYSAVVYNSSNQNVPIGLMTPLGSKYPIVIQNSANNYKNGGIQAQLLGYNYEKTRVIDRGDVVKQTNDFLEFLTDGKAKMILDWNGSALLVRVANAPTITYVSSYGNGITNVGFTWVEQGKYNDTEDLKRNGFYKVF